MKPSITESSLRNRHIENSPETNKLLGIWTITDDSKNLILNHANRYPTWDAWLFTFQKIELLKLKQGLILLHCQLQAK
jgi:hypothetical protein